MAKARKCNPKLLVIVDYFRKYSEYYIKYAT